MSKISRWHANAVQADSERKLQKELEKLPEFPWEMTTAEFLSSLQEQQEADGPSELYGWNSPYGLLPTMELHMALQLLDFPQPLASLLLAFPISRTVGKTDNQDLSRVVDLVMREFERRKPASSPVLLLLDCHVKKVSFGRWSFRPAGSSKYYPDAFTRGRGLADEVPEDITRRLISLVEIEAKEGDRGPEIEFAHVKSFDPEVFDKLTFPSFSGFTSAESIRLATALTQLLKKFRFSEVGIKEYAAMRSGYLQLLKEEVSGVATSAEPSDWAIQWSEFVTSRYPEATVPPKLEALSPNLEGGNIELPTPRLIKTPWDAEEYAAEVMCAMGFTNVLVSSAGPDGGIDVASEEALAQVKLEGRASTREQLQRLTGITLTRGTTALFFSLAGYTKSALEWAEATDMALFEFAYDGSLAAKSSLAVELHDKGSTALIGRT